MGGMVQFSDWPSLEEILEVLRKKPGAKYLLGWDSDSGEHTFSMDLPATRRDITLNGDDGIESRVYPAWSGKAVSKESIIDAIERCLNASFARPSHLFIINPPSRIKPKKWWDDDLCP